MPCTDLSPEDVIFGWTHGSTLYSELIQEEVHLEEPKRDGASKDDTDRYFLETLH